MTHLSDVQRNEIQALWKAQDDDLNAHLAASSVFSGRYFVIEDEVRSEMEAEGHGIPRGAAGLFGTEFARRLLQKRLSEFRALVEHHRKDIEEAVCVKFAYCKKRKHGDLETEGWTVATGVADALITYVTGFPLPVTVVSVYLVKRQILDSWCKCDKKSA